MSLACTQMPLALTMGDPAGCGPQITGAAWAARKQAHLPPFFVLGSKAVFAPFVPVQEILDPAEAIGVFETALPVLSGDIDLDAPVPGKPDPSHTQAILASIETATRLCLSGEASAVVTNPINKALLYGAGFAHPGHTEYLAHLCETYRRAEPFKPVMMLVGGGLRVALATIHMPLISVAGALTQEGLIHLGQVTHAALQRDFALLQPRIAFTGLNPHAGEAGTIGREEIEIINPAAEALRAGGIDISLARPADTVFAEARNGVFDAVIAMTHDQGLIPVKTLDFWGGVNVTLGLPIVRTSPDHGTAYAAAAEGTVRPDSLIAALQLAGTIAVNRAGQ